MFCPDEIAPQVARWKNEGGAVLQESKLRIKESSKSKLKAAVNTVAHANNSE
jgi:hypothetical protein